MKRKPVLWEQLLEFTRTRDLYISADRQLRPWIYQRVEEPRASLLASFLQSNGSQNGTAFFHLHLHLLQDQRS
jgi:hypothetical protein